MAAAMAAIEVPDVARVATVAIMGAPAEISEPASSSPAPAIHQESINQDLW